MSKIEKKSISKFFREEFNLRYNSDKIKKMKKYEKSDYNLQFEKLSNGKEGFILYYKGKEGLIVFLEDYLSLFDHESANSKTTIKVISEKIQKLKHDSIYELNDEFQPIKNEIKFTAEEINMMFLEFSKLDKKFSSNESEINRWIELKTKFFPKSLQ